MRERRRFSRLLSQDRATLRKQDIQEEGRLVDISPGGMRVLLSKDIEVGSLISGEFKIIPKTGGSFHVRGEVIWVKPANDKTQPPSYVIGIKFNKVSAAPL